MQGCNSRDREAFKTKPQSGQEVKGLGVVRVIRIASLNIHSERARGLEAALQVLRQGTVRVGILQETKLSGDS